ncbi:MAG: F0F1 ATP synthase subunit A [Planctomycetes bacterium]|nr:F0F1 ATP synthase subunit A [Planctomycetota bacterium]
MGVLGADSLAYLASADPMEHILDRKIEWLPDSAGVTLHMLLVLAAAALCLAIFPIVARRIAARGTGGRFGSFFEVILLFIRDEMVRPFLGDEGDRFLPIIWSLFFFILFCNLLGLIPGLATPTANISVTGALALFALVFYHAMGIKKQGLFHYLKANFLVGPWLLWPLMIPIEAMGHVIKPCALAIRLCANMVAGHLLLGVFISFTAVWTASYLLGLPIALVSATAGVLIMFLEILVAFIQAFVFAFLTTVFLSMALHSEH